MTLRSNGNDTDSAAAETPNGSDNPPKPTTQIEGVSTERKEVAVSLMFVDAVCGVIRAGNVDEGGTRVTNTNNPGYQRDPYERMHRLDKHGGGPFRYDLVQTLEVSLRASGYFAIMDGGGRWVKAQKAGVKKLWANVHTGLTRAQEAALFVEYDTERTRVPADARFNALLKAGFPQPLRIAKALGSHGYKVGKRGPTHISSITVLEIIDRDVGADLIKETAQYLEAAFQPRQEEVKGNTFMGVAMFVNAANGTSNGVLDKKRLVKILSVATALILYNDAKIKAGARLGTQASARWIAMVIAEAYNKSLGERRKVNTDLILNSKLAKKYEQRQPLGERSPKKKTKKK